MLGCSGSAHSELPTGACLQVSAPGLVRRAAIRLGVFAYLLFMLSSGVDGYFEGQALPDQLTARNITITLRTVVRGLSYLMTFLFAANTVGLTGKTYTRPQVSRTVLLLGTDISVYVTLYSQNGSSRAWCSLHDPKATLKRLRQPAQCLRSARYKV